MKKTLLWLDDIRDPATNMWRNWIARNVGRPDDFNILWAQDYEDFEDLLSMHRIDVVCFDHDLDTEHYMTDTPDDIDYAAFHMKTGHECAKLLVSHCLKMQRPMPQCFIQSSNPTGSENIRKVLLTYNQKINEPI